VKQRKADKTASKSRESKEHWDLRLYVAGQTARAVAAFANLQKICEDHLGNIGSK